MDNRDWGSVPHRRRTDSFLQPSAEQFRQWFKCLETNEMGRACGTLGEEERCRSVVVGILKARDRLEGIGPRRRIILRTIAKKVGLRARTALTL
jgi:hypothetical protein